MKLARKIINGQWVIVYEGQHDIVVDARNAQVAAESAKTAAVTAQAASEAASDQSEVAQVASESARDLALTYRDNAETAQTGAETAKGQSEAARDQSQAAQVASEAARDQALAYRDDAETAQTGAETAEGQSEAARDQSQAAQVASEAARDLALTYRDDAETAKAGAETAKNDAETAETNAAAAAAAASASETDAAASAAAAAASEATIGNFDLAGAANNDVIVFDGQDWVAGEVSGLPALSQGDLIIGNASNEGEAVSRQNLGKQKELFYKSLLGGILKTSLTSIYDGFERDGDSAVEPLGNADSGQPYALLEGSLWYDGTAAVRAITGTGVMGILNNGILHGTLRSGFNAKLNIIPTDSSERNGFYLWVDANNWFRISASQTAFYVDEKVAGVITNLATAFIPNGASFRRAPLDMNITYSGQSNLIVAQSVAAEVKTTAVSPTIFSYASEAAYIGIGCEGNGKINGFSLTKISFC